jgi:hypothetical protein
MLYWLPVFFIIAELVFINLLDKMISYSNANVLFVKYGDEKLDEYLKTKYSAIKGVTLFVAIFLTLEFIYFFVGLFSKIWMISVVYIAFDIFATIKLKLVKNTPIEKTIKRAKLVDFESSDIKFQRVLKLNELKANEIKTRDWINYIYPTIKIFAFIAIIVLHYQYNIL